MSHYAKRNPENPHGRQGGHFPAPPLPSKYQGMTPDQVLEKMAEDNAQDRRYVEHGPQMVSELRHFLAGLTAQAEMMRRLIEGESSGRAISMLVDAENRVYAVTNLLAKVEGRTP